MERGEGLAAICLAQAVKPVRMSNDRLVLSREGLEKLKQELEYLVTVRRVEVAERIRQAADFGDLRENNEYDEAKNEQAYIEARIATLEKTLRDAVVLDDSGDTGTSQVTIGATVTYEELDGGAVRTYTIVGSLESDPVNGKISNECPVGAALTGRCVGDVVPIDAPNGTYTVRILQIQRS